MIKAEVRRNENPSAVAERKRIVALINAEADRLENTGSPTTVMIIRRIASKIERRPE